MLKQEPTGVRRELRWRNPVLQGGEDVKERQTIMTSHDGFETLAIHAGQEPDPLTGAVVPPIYQASTFKQDGVGGLRGGYEYSRSGQPDQDRARAVPGRAGRGPDRAGLRLRDGRRGRPAQDGVLAR